MDGFRLMEGSMIKRVIASILVVAVVCGIGSAHADGQAAVEQAKKAADAWLKLVDAGNYQESWNQFAGIVKPRVSEEKWAEEAAALRKTLGPMTSRNFASAKYSTSLPGAPDGQYVVILYHSSFANKQSAIEQVVPMLDTDGQWRISGYHFVK
jgi:hypothetical protein